MSFEKYFGKEIKSKQKITIILGSGFHKYKCDDKNYFNDWKLLLMQICKKPILENENFLLTFESQLVNSNINRPATQTQNGVLDIVAKKLNEHQEKVNLNNYPSFIFNPSYVSDVIVLNFDEVAEKVCQYHFGAKISKEKYIKINNKSLTAQIHQTTRYKEVTFKNGGIIKFWHPHGLVSKPKNMILGLRQYTNHISSVEELRKHSKSTNRNTKEPTWYNKLTHQTVLILGARISDIEIDLWTAFVNRERNFAKEENKKHRKPIYQMREKDTVSNSNKKWFEPMFDESLSFPEQWEELEKLFK